MNKNEVAKVLADIIDIASEESYVGMPLFSALQRAVIKYTEPVDQLMRDHADMKAMRIVAARQRMAGAREMLDKQGRTVAGVRRSAPDLLVRNEGLLNDYETAVAMYVAAVEEVLCDGS